MVERACLPILLFLLLLGACTPGGGQWTGAKGPEVPAAVPEPPREPVEASSAVDHAVATTGDVITFSITVDYDPAYEVEPGDPGAEIAGFRITDIGRDEPVEAAGRQMETRWYKLRADLVGSYVLPPITVRYRASEAEEWQSLQTSEIFVEVETVLTDDAEDIRGLKPLRQIERKRPWWQYAAAGAAGAALLALALWWWRRRRREEIIAPLPAHEVAFAALERLRGIDFEDLEAVRRFYFEISEVVRAYVEARFRLNATDLTTEEILPQLAAVQDLPGPEREKLGAFLQATDRVKFAAWEPSQEEIGETYESALSFVEATRATEVAIESSALDDEAPV